MATMVTWQGVDSARQGASKPASWIATSIEDPRVSWPRWSQGVESAAGAAQSPHPEEVHPMGGFLGFPGHNGHKARGGVGPAARLKARILDQPIAST
jgi:hypothetical protein